MKEVNSFWSACVADTKLEIPQEWAGLQYLQGFLATPDWEHPVPMAVVLPLHLDFPDSAIRMATSEKLRTGKNEIIIQCCKKINFKWNPEPDSLNRTIS